MLSAMPLLGRGVGGLLGIRRCLFGQVIAAGHYPTLFGRSGVECSRVRKAWGALQAAPIVCLLRHNDSLVSKNTKPHAGGSSHVSDRLLDRVYVSAPSLR